MRLKHLREVPYIMGNSDIGTWAEGKKMPLVMKKYILGYTRQLEDITTHAGVVYIKIRGSVISIDISPQYNDDGTKQDKEITEMVYSCNLHETLGSYVDHRKNEPNLANYKKRVVNILSSEEDILEWLKFNDDNAEERIKIGHVVNQAIKNMQIATIHELSFAELHLGIEMPSVNENSPVILDMVDEILDSINRQLN